MRNGECFQRQKSEPHTKGIGSGLWPTPTKTPDAKNTGANRIIGPNSLTEAARLGQPTWPTPHGFSKDGKSNSPSGNELGFAVNRSLWPTPQAHDMHPGDPARVGRYGTKHGGRNLNDEVALFPTPRATDGSHGGPNQRDSAGNPGLSAVAQRWPTPNKGDGDKHTAKTNHKGGNPTLTNAVLKLPTPTRRDSRTFAGSEPMPGHQGGTNLIQTVGGQLSPDWVELLMAWPLSWTALGKMELSEFRAGWLTWWADSKELETGNAQ